MISPIFTINTAQPGVAFAANDSQAITLQIANTFGVQQVEWTFFGVSSLVTLPTITLTGVPFGTTANFTMPNTAGAGVTLLIQCKVNLGLTAGATDTDLITTSAVYITDNIGFIPIATGETFEIDPVLGWGGRYNTNQGASPAVITDATTARTLVRTDQNAIIQFTSGLAVSVTIPNNSAVPFSIGSSIMGIQMGAGQVSWNAGSGVTLNYSGGLHTTAKQYAVTCAMKVATNSWILTGERA